MSIYKVSVGVAARERPTSCFRNFSIRSGMEDAFPMRDVYHLSSVSIAAGCLSRTYRHFSRVSTLSSIIRPMNATSPPAVINSLSAAVGAFLTISACPPGSGVGKAYCMRGKRFQLGRGLHLLRGSVERRVAEGKGERRITRRKSATECKRVCRVPAVQIDRADHIEERRLLACDRDEIDLWDKSVFPQNLRGGFQGRCVQLCKAVSSDHRTAQTHQSPRFELLPRCVPGGPRISHMRLCL